MLVLRLVLVVPLSAFEPPPLPWCRSSIVANNSLDFEAGDGASKGSSRMSKLFGWYDDICFCDCFK